MKPLSAKEIIGNWVTLLLPINDDDSIDYERLAEEIDYLISVKPDGIYSNGTAGEFYNITEREFARVSMLLAEKCNHAKIPFQIGVSHMSPVISFERLKRIFELQPSAVQVILPDWFKPTDEEAISFLSKMAEAADEIGLVLYNPPHAKRNLTPQEILQLKQHIPQLVGVKVPGGDAQWYEEMKVVSEQLSVFIPGHNIATGHKLGVSHGAYSNMACLNPKAAQVWTDQIKTDLEAALELESRIHVFLEKHITPYISELHYSNQAVDKLLAAIGGWGDIGTRLRWPYRGIPGEEARRLRPMAIDQLPEFFVNN